MGNPFSNLTNEGLEETQDRLGGGYQPKDTDIYTGKVKMAYAGKSSGGAHNVTLIVSGGDFGDGEYRETVYITNKKGENFFLNKQDQTKKVALPGFTTIDDLCLCTVGKPLAEVDFQEKVINIYDYEQRKEVPTSAQVAVELLGQEVSLAIIKSTENQTEKDNSGNYVPKADGSTRDVNNIDKVFNTGTRMTVAEARGGATESKFWDAWLEKNKGQTRDRTNKQVGNGTQAGAPQGGQGPAGGSAPRTSLFGAKS